MSGTPTRRTAADTSFTSALTPVRFLNSPNNNKQSTGNDSNYAVCQARLEQITKTLLDNHAKWKLAQQRGLSLCNSIVAIKTRSLEANTKSTDDSTSLYPKELQPYCDKLAIITSIFVDITANARETLKQLRALRKLPGANNEIFQRSWQLTQYVEFVEKVLPCYEKETLVKQYVMENLAHCGNTAELIRSACAWEYPQYTDEWLTLYFAYLTEEINTHKR